MIFDVNQNQEVLNFAHHSSIVSDIDWFDSSLVVSASYDKYCKILDLQTQKIVYSSFLDGFVQCVRFNRSGFLFY